MKLEENVRYCLLYATRDPEALFMYGEGERPLDCLHKQKKVKINNWEIKQEIKTGLERRELLYGGSFELPPGTDIRRCVFHIPRVKLYTIVVC